MENDLKMSEKWTKNANCEQPYCCRQERNTISGLGGDKYYPIVVLVYLSNW